jgi:hypothetical protein
MVAKKGRLQAHHFAHHAQSIGRSCVSAGETALHKFAKRILDERLEVALPAMIVEERGEKEIVVQAEKRTFDQAILETKDGQIVPDVVLILRDRRLIVEFKVTHPCDEQKIARIQSMDVGAIEIDLSRYRDLLLSEIGEQILYEAPRIWLHNPRERGARERLADKARLRDGEKKKQVERYRAAYRHRLPSKVAGYGDCETTVRNDGLGDLINLPVDGSGCFTVAVAEWQSAILLALLAAATPPFRTRNGLYAIRRKGWLDQKFVDITEDVASAVEDSGLRFASPRKAVEAYLEQLKQLGFVHSGRTEIWKVSSTLLIRIEEARELRERPNKRTAEIRQLVGEMLSGLPNEETTRFVFDRWWITKAPGRGYSPSEASGFDETEWQSFLHDLTNIATRIRFSPREGLDLIGLPYEGSLSRALDRKRLAEEERERGKQAKLEADKAARVSRLRNRALEQIGREGEAWVVTPNFGTQGRTPIDAAASGEAGYDDALRALDRRMREIVAEEQARDRKVKAVAALAALARTRYFDAERASLWMRGKRRELNGKSPEEFVVDDATRQRCEDLLPMKRSRR